MPVCPNCGSRKAVFYDYDGSKLLECNSCGFDESDKYEELPTSKVPTKHRQVYKVGGGLRSRK